MALVHVNLPSGKINKDGSIILRAEAYSRIPLEDLRQLAEYQSIFIKHQLLGRKEHPALLLVQVALLQHSLQTKRLQIKRCNTPKLLHNDIARMYMLPMQKMGKHILVNNQSSIQMTQIHSKSWYALDPKELVPSANAIQQGSKRYALLSKHPGVYFQWY
jgi:hypothetical protein